MMMLLLGPIARRMPPLVLFAWGLALLGWGITEALRVASWWVPLFCLGTGMVLLGSIPAAIAYRHGRAFLRWWIYGTLQFSGALSRALRLQTIENPDGTLRRCPRCRKWIQAEAALCGYCRNEVSPLPKAVIASEKRAAKERVRLADKLPRWIDR